MRTSFSNWTALVCLSFFGIGVAESSSQAILPGNYRGIYSGTYSFAKLILEPHGRFVLELSSGDHGGPHGAGDWELLADSLQLVFDDESLVVPSNPESSYVVASSAIQSDSDSLRLSVIVLDEETSEPIRGVRLQADDDIETRTKWTDRRGKAHFAFQPCSLNSLRIEFIGYQKIEVPIPDSGATSIDIIAFLAASDQFRVRSPISTTKTWTLGTSWLENGDLFLADKDSSKTFTFWN
jgi:hypothetical protein